MTTLRSSRFLGSRAGIGAPRTPGPARGAAVLVAAAVLLATSASVAGCGTAARHDPRPGRTRPATPFGRLAGYVWSGHVRSIQASWRVPAMRPGSPAGHASTWIAAQAPGPLSGGPFIQVGVTEDEGVARAARRRADVYTAFWSATTLRFHPAPLFPVGAGDRLQASLTLSGSRWRVTIADLTTGRRASFSTAAEARGSFNLAEWLQEDPTDERGAPEPYPRLGLVRFDRLAVDGRPPLYRGLDAQWMSVGGKDLAPTPLRGGGFALQATSLTRAGARYLAAVAPEDRVQSVFDGELSQWTPATPPGRIEAESASLATALQQYARALRSGTWPLAARRPIAALASRAGTLTALVRTVPRAAGAARRAWAARYGAEAAAMAHRAHEVRRALHLPEAGAASVLAPVG